MNALARLLVVVYSLLWVAACGGLAALAWNPTKQLDLKVGNVNVVAYVDAAGVERWALTGVLVLLALLGAGAIALAVGRPLGRSRGAIRWRQADGSLVEMRAATIEGMLRDALEGMRGVRAVRPVVRASGTSIETTIALTVDGSTSVAELSHVASDVTFRVLREQVGALDVKRPVVQVEYLPGAAPRPAATMHSPAAGQPAGAAPSIPPPPTKEPTPDVVEESREEGDEHVR